MYESTEVDRRTQKKPDLISQTSVQSKQHKHIINVSTWHETTPLYKAWQDHIPVLVETDESLTDRSDCQYIFINI